MRALVPVLMLAAALSGCLDGGQITLFERPPADIVSHWNETVEPSMAPDFTGQGDTYPVLLVHQHYVKSDRERERDDRGGEVVCADLAGNKIPLYDPMPRDAAICHGPPADPPTGRVYMERAEFEERAPDGLVVKRGGCGGGLLFLGQETQEFAVQTPMHDFHVALLANGTFAVDGRWVEPGTTLKVGYHIDFGSKRDERYVRVAFDNPGRWLMERVAPFDTDLEENVPLPVEQGDGLAVDVPLDLEGPLQVVVALVEATPSRVDGILSMRLVHHRDQLTEVRVDLATADGKVSWFGAGRTGAGIRVLGAMNGSVDGAAVSADYLWSFPPTWGALRGAAQGDTTDVRLASGTAFTSPDRFLLNTAPGLAVPCDGACVFVDAEGLLGDPGWRWAALAEPVASSGARTIEVLVHGEGDPTQAWWHQPA